MPNGQPLNDEQAAEVLETLADLTEPERLGVVVAQAYGNALYERDQARGWAIRLEQDLTECRRHARALVAALRNASGWAQDAAVSDSAESFLDALESPETPDDPQVDR